MDILLFFSSTFDIDVYRALQMQAIFPQVTNDRFLAIFSQKEQLILVGRFVSLSDYGTNT